MPKGKEGKLLPEIKSMLFLSSMGHIILFILVTYLSLRFQHYRVTPPVYNVNLVDFIGEKGGGQKAAAKNSIKAPVKKISPPPVVKEKPKEIKKIEPEKPKVAEEKPKEIKKETKKVEPEKPKATKKEEIKKEKKASTDGDKKKESKESAKKAEPTNTSTQATNSTSSSVVASKGTGMNLAGGYHGSLSLDNVNFPFTYYLILIRDKISEHWDPNFDPLPLGGGQGVVIAFKIQKDGNISEPFIEKTSGAAYLDQSALRAVLSAVPFPPLPKEFAEDYLGIHFGFEYTKEG